ncbi:hypothetical protein LX73_0790 [Fodinibius salinus]|uniref:Uncharacterized protein n=1 Tax=Fodinibius salinus TaxID=860790 RepID=A0A5D3YNN4_9BACT|nr:hypothetical protein [Fodinibius salinus]TYP95484.1 hypothetical protein LX73_0790 [Fodinibius salinus]
MSFVGLLLHYFDILSASVLKIYFGGTFTGLFLGLSIQLYYSLVNPSDWLFQSRYHIEGAILGGSIGSYSLTKYSFSNGLVNIFEIIIPLVVGLILGISWIKSAKYRTLKDWKGNLIQQNTDNIIFSDAGTLTDPNHSNTKGTVMLTQNEIIFSPSNAQNHKIRTDLSEMNPLLEKSGFDFFSIPTGIQLTQERSIHPYKFPRYWLEKIRNIRSGIEYYDGS